MEYDDASAISLEVWAMFLMKPEALCAALKSHIRLSSLLKHEDAIPICDSITKSCIPSNKLHIADLSFAGVPIETVGLRAVLISVLFSARARKDQNLGAVGRCAYPALPLPTKRIVDFTTSVFFADKEFHFRRKC
ncbi:hypothetical protein [Gemmatimonas groenlandica]|uniref:hypothetical protein n=1 Tax=Gemmatimonas groenlandica TaxID=2732249 RepID=UPI001E48D1F3|nr:hypothetical protein [Gemmatimonas groenlandica]